ncbi:hypothetical protein EDD37DRAFT_393332 [Exophiala viscosa]|nr:hypothetical protein EDD37DRAFT_393332 [Exophiala viscosa]
MSNDDEESCTDDVEGRAGVSTIAQVKSILELIEVKTADGDVEGRIQDMVPSHDVDNDDEVRNDSTRIVRLRDVLDNISAPTNAILDAAKKLFMFSVPESLEAGNVLLYIPSPSLLIRAWEAFFQQCAISGVKIDSDGFDTAALQGVLDDLLASENDSTHEDGGKGSGTVIVPVVKAILRRFADPATPLPGDVNDHEIEEIFIAAPATSSWNQTETCEQVGGWLLESMKRESKSQSSAKQVQLDDFRRQWTELLPDSWAGKACDVAALVKSVDGVTLARDEQGNEVLRFTTPESLEDILGLGNGLGLGLERGRIQSTAAKAAPARNALDAAKNEKKRKWHEKFGAQRAVAAVKR